MANKDYFKKRGQCVIDKKILKYVISNGKELIKKNPENARHLYDMLIAVYLIAYYAVFNEDDDAYMGRLAANYEQIYLLHKMDINDKSEAYNGTANSGSLGGAPKGNKNAAKYKDDKKDTKTTENQNSIGENDDIQYTQKLLNGFVECIPKTTLIE